LHMPASASSIGLSTQVLWGNLLFLAASCVWAAYTVALRGTSLSALQLCAVVSGWSGIFAALLWLLTPSTRLLTAPLGDVLLQVLVQGVVAGVMGITAYGYAVKILGTQTPSTLGAFVPVVSALGGALLLGEALSGYALVGVCVVTAGVLAMQFKRNLGS
jgi:drug/metabolite transporter (DMT)-like permease